MNPSIQLKSRYLALLRRQFEKALGNISDHQFERYDEGNFLLVRFHRAVPSPEPFWQVAGENAKNIQKHLHDIIATIEPDVIKKYTTGHEILIRVPQIGLGSASWAFPLPARCWTPGKSSEEEPK